MLKMSDTKCSVVKQMISHYLCEGLPQEFVADAGNTWDPHPLCLDQNTLGVVGCNYTVIIDGQRAPVVISHKSTVAT
jgi:hypothetical protein